MSSATLQIGIKADYDFLDDGTPDELGQRVLERVRTAIASTGALDDPLAPCDEHEIGVAKTLFVAGCFFLPWLWIVNVFYFRHSLFDEHAPADLRMCKMILLLQP